MRTLYLELNMGAAGDMLSAALLELLPKDRQENVLHTLNGLFPGRVHVERQSLVKCGIPATHLQVIVDGEEEESVDENAHDHVLLPTCAATCATRAGRNTRSPRSCARQ